MQSSVQQVALQRGPWGEGRPVQLAKWVAEWNSSFFPRPSESGRPLLTMIDNGAETLVIDTRPFSGGIVYTLTGHRQVLYQNCRNPIATELLIGRLTEQITECDEKRV